MNHLEKVKVAIDNLRAARKRLDQLNYDKHDLLRRITEAEVAVSSSVTETIRQLRNVCPERPVVYDKVEYSVSGNTLKEDYWNGVILDAETATTKV